MTFFCDALPRDPQRERERRQLLDRINGLRVQIWSDGDAELRELLVEAQAKLRELDGAAR